MVQNKNPENRTPMEKVLYEVKKIIVGQDHLLERMVVALLQTQIRARQKHMKVPIAGIFGMVVPDAFAPVYLYLDSRLTWK